MLLLDTQIKRSDSGETILKRIACADKKAVAECLEVYGDLIWSLVKKKITSEAEAKKITLEIFSDVWKYAARFDVSRCSEKTFLALIADHHLRIY